LVASAYILIVSSTPEPEEALHDMLPELSLQLREIVFLDLRIGGHAVEEPLCNFCHAVVVSQLALELVVKSAHAVFYPLAGVSLIRHPSLVDLWLVRPCDLQAFVTVDFFGQSFS
jgi:hypothetical protein